jgi:fluoride exporter
MSPLLGLAVGAGGAAGSMLRYLLGLAVERGAPGGFPWATLLINVTGAFVLGLLLRTMTGPTASPALRLALTTGFCGGYTTFSTFSYETLVLVEDGHWPRAAAYAIVSVLLGLGAVAAGASLGASLAGSPRPL